MLQFTISHATQGERPLTLSQEDLVGEGAVIGRASRSQVVLDDPGVSRVHARLSLRQGSVFITDVGSTAGTALNGQRLPADKPTRLAAGDRLGIGPFSLTLGGADTGGDALRTTIMAEPPVSAYMPLAAVVLDQLPRWTGGELAVRVVRIIDETSDVKTFVLAAETPTLFSYLPGQATTVQVSIDGKPHTRSYSISSSPSRPHTLAITVKRLPPSDGSPGGMFSTWLHERVAPGDTLTISGLHGSFSCLKHPSPRILLIAAGIGITPMLSMVRWLGDTASETDVVLVYAARTSGELIAHHELTTLARANPRLRLVLTTSRPEPGSGWSGPVGRPGGELLPLAVPDYLRRTIFCCGPEGFMQLMRSALQPTGFPMAKYHEENFGSRRGTGGGLSGPRTALHTNQ